MVKATSSVVVAALLVAPALAAPSWQDLYGREISDEQDLYARGGWGSVVSGALKVAKTEAKTEGQPHHHHHHHPHIPSGGDPNQPQSNNRREYQELYVRHNPGQHEHQHPHHPHDHAGFNHPHPHHHHPMADQSSAPPPPSDDGSSVSRREVDSPPSPHHAGHTAHPDHLPSGHGHVHANPNANPADVLHHIKEVIHKAQERRAAEMAHAHDQPHLSERDLEPILNERDFDELNEILARAYDEELYEREFGDLEDMYERELDDEELFGREFFELEELD